MTREEAIKIINFYDLGFYDLNGEKIPADKLADAFDMAIEALKNERPKGHWILSQNQDKEDTDNGNYRFECSNCGYSDTHSKATEVPYCWHCGADMRGEDE